MLAAADGDGDEANARLVAAATSIDRFPMRLVDHDVLTGWAVAAHLLGDDERAAWLLAVLAANGIWTRSPGMYAVYVHYRRVVRARIGDERWRHLRSVADAERPTVRAALAAELARIQPGGGSLAS